MTERDPKKGQIIAELRHHLTETERADLEAWERSNLPGDGSASSEDWPGWYDVVIRRASSERSMSMERLAGLFYSGACAVAILFIVAVCAEGLLIVLGVLDDRKGTQSVIEANLNGGAQVVFFFVVGHVIAKWAARSLKRSDKVVA